MSPYKPLPKYLHDDLASLGWKNTGTGDKKDYEFRKDGIQLTIVPARSKRMYIVERVKMSAVSNSIVGETELYRIIETEGD